MPSVAEGIMSLMTGTESVEPRPLLVCPLWLKMFDLPAPCAGCLLPCLHQLWTLLLELSLPEVAFRHGVLSQQPKIMDTNAEKKP